MTEINAQTVDNSNVAVISRFLALFTDDYTYECVTYGDEIEFSYEVGDALYDDSLILSNIQEYISEVESYDSSVEYDIAECLRDWVTLRDWKFVIEEIMSSVVGEWIEDRSYHLEN